MQIEKKNLSETNWYRQEGYEIVGSRGELLALKNAIEYLLDSNAYHCFKCNAGTAIFEVSLG